MTGVDYDREAVRYQAGRGVPIQALTPWHAHLAAYLRDGQWPLLDLGAGTGIWTRALATWFDAAVVALEPSAGMRSVATQVGLPTKSSCVAGRAEALPFRSATFGAAWLSTVVHHLSDLTTCTCELRRVLIAGAPVLIRNSFSGRQEEVELFRHFPAAASIGARWPRLGEVVSTFKEAGFSHSQVMRVREDRWQDLQELRGWAVAMRHTDSALAPMSDDEFAEGLRKIDAAISRGERPRRMGTDLVILS